MTPETYVKAQIASFAHREAFHLGGQGMTAIACILRNRVKAGWFGGDWLGCIEHAQETSAYLRVNPVVGLEISSPAFRQLLSDVEDIYHGTFADELTQGIAEAGKPVRSGLYWLDPAMAEQVSPWFLDNILRQPDRHQRMAQVGPLWIFN